MLLKPLFGGPKVVLVDFEAVEIEAHVMSRYAGTAGAQVSIDDFHSWLGVVFKEPFIKLDRLLGRVYLLCPIYVCWRFKLFTSPIKRRPS